MSLQISIRFLKSLCAILGLITLVACSSDSGSSTATATTTSGGTASTSSDGGLSAKVPSAVSVVPTSTQTSASANPSAMIATKEIQGALGILANASTPYESDEAFEISNDPASNVFEFLSTVMGVMSYTGYEYTYDKGPVKAQFDWYAANNESSQQKLLVEAVVDSKLTNGSLPLVAEVWFKVKKTGLDVKAIATVYEAPSTTNRFGKLKVNLTFTDTWASATGGALFEIDTNASGQLTISAKQSMPQGMGDGKVVNLVAAADGVVDDTANTGTLNYTNKMVVESWSGLTKGDELSKETGIITFNADYVYQKAACSVTTADTTFNFYINQGMVPCADSTEKLYARANPTRVAYNYGLYDKDTKKRKNVRTGMMVEHTASDGTVYEGWSSEWGLWLAPQTPDASYDWNTVYTPPDGSTISEVKFDGTKVAYTAEQRDFKIEKELTSTINLDDLDGIELKTQTYVVDDSAIGTGSPPTTYNTRKSVVIKYDKATKKFMRVKECSNSFCYESSQFTAITPVEHVHYVNHWDCSSTCKQSLVGLVYDFNDSRLEVKKVYDVASNGNISNPDVKADDTAASTVGLNYDVDLWLMAGNFPDQKAVSWSSATPTQAKLTNRESVSTVSSDIKLVDLSWRNQNAQSNCYSAFTNAGSVTYLNDNAASDTNSKAAVFANHTYMLDSKMRLYKCASYADGSCVDDSKRVASIAIDLGQGSQSRCTTATGTGCRLNDGIDGLVPVSELQTITLSSYADTSKCNDLQPRKYNVNYSFKWAFFSPILALKKADNTYVAYEKPLSFSVVLDGKATDLTYYGFNSGLSNWSCDSNSCFPEIKFIPDGTELVHKTSNGDTTYLSKALFVEESLTDVTSTATVPESLKVTAQEVSTDFTQPTYRETPTASKVCIVDRNPVDSDGNILESITGENAAKFCS